MSTSDVGLAAIARALAKRWGQRTKSGEFKRGSTQP